MPTGKKTEKVVSPEPVVTTPDLTQTPPEPTFEPPEKYQGKSLEEVIAMNEEAQKQIGRQGDELGKGRKDLEKAHQDLNYVSNMYQTQQAKTQEQAPQQPESPVIDFDDLGGSVTGIVDKKIKAFEERQAKRQQQEQYQEATQNYMRGKNTAYQGNPGLYEGIEKEVETAVWNALLSGITSRWDVGNSTVWEDAAWLIHKHKKNWDKLVPAKINPVSATGTETPGGMKPPSGELPSEALAFDPHGEEMLELAVKGGAKKDEFIKKVKERRKQFGASRGGE